MHIELPSPQQPTKSVSTPLNVEQACLETQSAADVSRYSCYLMSKSNGLTQYIVEVDATELRILSVSKGKVKLTLRLNDFHIKTMPQESRTGTGSDLETSDDSPT